MNNVRDMRMTYMTQQEWIELENGRVLQYYDDIHSFVTRLCLAEKLPQSCISTTMVIYHKYFLLKHKFDSEFEKYLICAACVFLSVKICNQLTPLRELVIFFLKLYNRHTNFNLTLSEELIFRTSEEMTQIEFALLSACGFDMNIELPYRYIHILKSYFIDYLKDSKLIIITTNFINDSFKLPLCLYYDPLLIALASLYLVGYYFKIVLPDTKEGVRWFQIVDAEMKLERVVEVGEMINKIYKFSNENKTKTSSFVKDENVLTFSNGEQAANVLQVRSI